MDTDTGSLDIPSLTSVPVTRAPAPSLTIPPAKKSPIDVLKDPRFATLTTKEKLIVMRGLHATMTGSPVRPTPATFPTTVQPGRAQAKPIMPEVARKAKLSDQAQQIMRLGNEMKNLYNKKIKPKIDSGQISPMGQGLEYTYRGIARGMGHEPDPDVQDFITKSGNFATMVNSYYSQAGGGRGGVQGYQVITQPHIPHPPEGAYELLSGKWDLQKQGEQLPTILQNVQLDENQRAVNQYNDGGTGAAAEDPVQAALRKHGLGR